MDPITQEIVALSKKLIEIPSVTVGTRVRIDEVHRAADFIENYFKESGAAVRRFGEKDAFPSMLASFPGEDHAPVMLSGHFDVVDPEPDDSQFVPRIEGDYLVGRGAGDMKTVVATYLVWMKDRILQGAPFPKINLLLVGNEETGEFDPMGTGHVLKVLKAENGYQPQLLIAGERTEETGTGTLGQVCVENRGVVRFVVQGRGTRGHSGMGPKGVDLTKKLIKARKRILKLARRGLTLHDDHGWQSQIRFPFLQIGIPDVFNINPDTGVLGVEIRPIPEDDVQLLFKQIEAYCKENNLGIIDALIEEGSICPLNHTYLQKLLKAILASSGEAPVLGRKLAGTSARFAPGGFGLVWGQSGIGPHSKEERHFIPSILPYYKALDEFGNMTAT